MDRLRGSGNLNRSSAKSILSRENLSINLKNVKEQDTQTSGRRAFQALELTEIKGPEVGIKFVWIVRRPVWL